MKVEWFAGLPKEKHEERKALVKGASPTLKVLKNILEKRLVDLADKQVNPAHYDSPAWAYMQADLNGSMRELKRVIELLDQEEM